MNEVIESLKNDIKQINEHLEIIVKHVVGNQAEEIFTN